MERRCPQGASACDLKWGHLRWNRHTRSATCAIRRDSPNVARFGSDPEQRLATAVSAETLLNQRTMEPGLRRFASPFFPLSLVGGEGLANILAIAEILRHRNSMLAELL